MTREHACRAILIAARPSDEEAAVRAWITAHCQLSGAGGKSVCSEQVAFALSGRLRDALRNVVFAHLESDLPLVFFWQGDFSDRWEPHLYRRIDRLVVDSTTWTRSWTTQVQRLRTAWRDSGARFVVLDVAWMRIFPFRQALAGAFDTALAQASLCQSPGADHHPRPRPPGHRRALRFVDRVQGRLVARPGRTRSLSRRGRRRSRGWNCAATATAGSPSPANPDAHFLHVRVRAGGSEATQVSPVGSDDLATLVSERLSRGGNTPLYFKLWRQVAGWQL